MENIPTIYIDNYKREFVFITIIYILSFYIFKLYKSLWIHAGIDEFMLSISGCIMANILSAIWCTIMGSNLPLGVSILAALFSIIYVVGFRISFRIYRRVLIYFSYLDKRDYKRVIVFGAGSAGTMIINEMKRRQKMKYYPVGLIDDNIDKQGAFISGVKVIGGRSKIKEAVTKMLADEIIIAIPSLKSKDKIKIIDLCKATGCKVRIIPGMYEIINGKVSIKHIRDVEVDDLLGRDTIQLDNEGIAEYVAGKTVLVTGGGGSIGSELCRQIARFYPKELLILDIYENNAYDLQNELKRNFPRLNLKVLIASVRDKKRLDKIFNVFKPEVVFHAAAHKHVPLMEYNPSEAVKNNIFGTMNLAECADKYYTKRFVLISTDKAVNPTNIMGASKRACEMIVQSMDKSSKTEFVAVRFGNVLGSNGSVIPLFKKQIAVGGPVTVTNKYITRYFMTIPEAAQLVLQAGAYAEGGEIFVLDMGKPVKIYDLACDLIRLSGFEPHKDIKIEITGLRPGEKLHEELLMDAEGLKETKHKKIFIGRPTFNDIRELKRKFDEIRPIVEFGSKEEIIKKVEELVQTYKPIKVEQKDSAKKEIAATIDKGIEAEVECKTAN